MSIPFDKKHLALYYIAGSQDFAGDTDKFLDTLLVALQAGISCFQFRDKGAGSLCHHDARLALARSAKLLCHQHHVPFIINDDTPLAKAIKADGIHLGQDDLGSSASLMLPKLRQHFGIIGVSINTPSQAQSCYRLYQQGMVDYFGVGPIFATNSKGDHSTPVGMTFPRQLRELGIDTPLVAIGGIKLPHVRELISHGADGVAVISAISTAEEVTKTVREFLAQLTKQNHK